jgi:hypothetical protein
MCDINVNTDTELLQKEYNCNVLLLQKKLQEKLLLIETLNKQQLHTNIKIDLDAYFLSRTVEIKSELPAVDVPTSDTMILKEKLKKQKNIKDNVVLPTQTDIINKALYDFLKTDTEYKKDAVIFIETFHKIISDKLNLHIKKLNNNIFKEVNKEYIVEIVMSCKQKDILKGVVQNITELIGQIEKLLKISP